MSELSGKRIFIVEDDVANMAVYSVILQQSDAIVIQDNWNSGTVALLTRHMPVDIILLDLMLKHNVSGYEIFDAIRTHPEFSQIPIVAVSASDPSIEIPRTMERGFAGFIGKPIGLHQFPKQVASCIDGEHVWSAT